MSALDQRIQVAACCRLQVGLSRLEALLCLNQLTLGLLLLRFDLSSISSTSITRATLKLYVTSLIEGTAPIALFGVPSNSWTETGVTWNNQPAFGSQLLSTSLPTIGWASFNVTSFVNSQLAGDKKVSLMLWDTNQAIKLATFNSRENSLNRPVLEVTK